MFFFCDFVCCACVLCPLSCSDGRYAAGLESALRALVLHMLLALVLGDNNDAAIDDTDTRRRRKHDRVPPPAASSSPGQSTYLARDCESTVGNETCGGLKRAAQGVSIPKAEAAAEAGDGVAGPAIEAEKPSDGGLQSGLDKDEAAAALLAEYADDLLVGGCGCGRRCLSARLTPWRHIMLKPC